MILKDKQVKALAWTEPKKRSVRKATMAVPWFSWLLSRWPLTAETWVRARVSPCGVWCTKWDRFYHNISPPGLHNHFSSGGRGNTGDTVQRRRLKSSTWTAAATRTRFKLSTYRIQGYNLSSTKQLLSLYVLITLTFRQNGWFTISTVPHTLSPNTSPPSPRLRVYSFI
jgi:hypothetical protein